MITVQEGDYFLFNGDLCIATRIITKPVIMFDRVTPPQHSCAIHGPIEIDSEEFQKGAKPIPTIKK